MLTILSIPSHPFIIFSQFILLRYGRARLGFGYGQEHEYEWEKVQRLIIKRCINGKVELQGELDDLEPFRFSHETLSSSIRLLLQLNEKVPQEDVPDADTLRLDSMVADGHEVSTKMLPLVEAIIYVVTLAKARLDPSMTLDVFAAAWLDDSNKDSMAYCSANDCPISRLSLRHLSSLYEVLEDIICDAIVCNIDADYAEPLDPAMTGDCIAQLVSFSGGLRQFESAWKRFLMRYLRQPHPLPPTHTLDIYAELIPFGRGRDIDERDDLLEVCSNIRLSQSLSILSHVRDQIYEEDRERERQQQRVEPQSLTGNSSGAASSSSAPDQGMSGSTAGPRPPRRALPGRPRVRRQAI